jgi:1,2-dihydroxy-3-keto-5-methylthiopentene dioxygenase
MTLLQVMADGDAADVRLRTRDPAQIGRELARRGVLFDRWPTLPGFHAGTSHTQILAHYADRVAELNAGARYRHIDVARLHRDPLDPHWVDKARAARLKFLSEHFHAEDEVRFFVAGRGCFYLHLAPQVVALVCEGGDLVSVPAGTRHWFDMGARPGFVAIRFFEEEDGWIGEFTGETIGERFPALDQLVVA